MAGGDCAAAATAAEPNPAWTESGLCLQRYLARLEALRLAPDPSQAPGGENVDRRRPELHLLFDELISETCGPGGAAPWGPKPEVSTRRRERSGGEPDGVEEIGLQARMGPPGSSSTGGASLTRPFPFHHSIIFFFNSFLPPILCSCFRFCVAAPRCLCMQSVYVKSSCFTGRKIGRVIGGNVKQLCLYIHMVTFYFQSSNNMLTSQQQIYNLG